MNNKQQPLTTHDSSVLLEVESYISSSIIGKNTLDQKTIIEKALVDYRNTVLADVGVAAMRGKIAVLEAMLELKEEENKSFKLFVANCNAQLNKIAEIAAKSKYIKKV